MVYATKCEYNIDTGRHEMEDIEGNQYWFDVYAVEDKCSDNIYKLSALDYLLYNEPVEYVNLLLSGELKDYMHQRPVYLQDKNNMI